MPPHKLPIRSLYEAEARASDAQPPGLSELRKEAGQAQAARDRGLCGSRSRTVLR